MRGLLFSFGLFLCVLLISATENPTEKPTEKLEKSDDVEAVSKEPIIEEKIKTDNTGAFFLHYLHKHNFFLKLDGKSRIFHIDIAKLR